jgi:hypothetical protein
VDENIKEALTSKENSFDDISLDHNLDNNDLSRENTNDSITEPSPEFLNQLNRIGDLPKQYDDVAVQVRDFNRFKKACCYILLAINQFLQVSMISGLQTKLASDVHKVKVDILPRKVDKEDLQLPTNLVEQIDMLKQGQDILCGILLNSSGSID